jgi:UDP-N-acetylglucosamine enolpyruvyl transferase
MAPREGSSIAPHGGVLDERLNVHGVKGLKVCDLSICPDNVGCNTFSVSTNLSLLTDCVTYILLHRLLFLSVRNARF